MHPSPDNHVMTAAQLVYRMVSVAIDSDDPRAELERLEGALYDAASAAHVAADEWGRTIPAYRAEFSQNAAELRELAGYVQRVAAATPEPTPTRSIVCESHAGYRRPELEEVRS